MRTGERFGSPVMVRIALVVLASLGLGAAGMWLASNFKLRVEPVGGATTASEPGRLPERIPVIATPTDTTRPERDQIRIAVAQEPEIAPAPKPSDKKVETLKKETIIRIEDQEGIRWANANEAIRLVGEKPTIVFSKLPNSTIAAAIGSTALEIKPGNYKAEEGTESVLEFDLASFDAKIRPGSSTTVKLTRTSTTGEQFESTVTLHRRLAATTKFFLDAAETTAGLPTIPVTANVIDVYGSFLVLAGRADAGLTGLSFLALVDGKVVDLPIANSTIPGDGSWRATLKMPGFAAEKAGTIFVRGDFSTAHTYADKPATVKFVVAPPKLPTPSVVVERVTTDASNSSIQVAASDQATSDKIPMILANTRRVKVTLKADAVAKAVSLQVDGQTIDVKPSAGTNVVFETVDLGPGRDHVLKATAHTGGASGKTAQVDVHVVTSKPAVESVSAPGFGQSQGVGSETVTVRFSQANRLQRATVIAGAFEVIHNEADKGATLVKGEPKFDDVTNAATLTVSPIKPGSYAVRVKKTIADIYGNAIVVVPGTSGDNAFETVLFTQTVDKPLASAVPSAFSMSTGPNVEFKEFEPRKIFLNGFNPADRVETRVVRLYYNRDAARVVQVVNRDARAFNAQGVDVRRRVADRSRDTANQATDERKSVESLAVQAATEARAAENKLKELQSKMTQARNQSATATAQIGQRQLQLESAQRTQGRERADTFDDPAQTRVQQLEADIAKLKTAREAGAAATEESVLESQKLLAEKQRKQAATIGEVRTELDKRKDVGDSNAQIAEIRRLLVDPATKPAEIPKLQADLEVANQNHSQIVANALAQNPALATKLDDAAIDVQKQQLDVERKQASFGAGKELIAKERALVDAKRNLSRAQQAVGDASAGSLSELQTELRGLQSVVTAAKAKEESLQAEISTAMNDVQAKRIKEVELTLKARELDQKELRARENQFRSEVAAAKEDADIYAPGKTDSYDPVRQCSLSVIGEGLIQIRGPIKGVNIIRTMINQIDAPTGQVRIGVHTVQVNGERVDRMNKVVANIQRYLDHSRFLTAQSSQMLRKAVTAVAARKAEECAATLAPGCTQADRDAKYLTCFFGKDFIDELRVLDSEFLRTGNKLLSLHSMDSTSLSAALTLLALAKNDIRAEILQEFATQTQTKLPEAEATFYQAGLACPTKCEACFDKKFCMLAQNAKFESFRGFFNLEIQGADTLTPVQREFVRLAQIFKTRLVTELELRQRVIERSLLEDRMGDYEKELREARDRDEESRKALIAVQDKMQTAIAEATIAFGQALTIQETVEAQVRSQDSAIDNLFTSAGYKFVPNEQGKPSIKYIDEAKRQSLNLGGETHQLPTVEQNDTNRLKNKKAEEHIIAWDWKDKDKWLYERLDAAWGYMNQFNYISKEKDELFKKTKEQLREIQNDKATSILKFATFHGNLKLVLAIIRDNVALVRAGIKAILNGLQKEKPDIPDVLNKFATFRDDILSKLSQNEPLRETILALFKNKLDPAFHNLQQSSVLYQAAQRRAQLARRPLDEKKLLDMLIDEMEDKYIELLDGTRAHTANVDNYLKALSTALDDDFNTQFYNPAFAKIRTLGASWDVQLGQIESTNVLTNNRVFAKVSPAASMEFDLPKRDIFIKEAFKGAKAAVDEYGALLSDPTFLSLAKMYGGTPTAATFGAGGSPAVRGVLPGQSSTADEMLMAQAGSNRKEFGAALEALIPDPAVYKFETGTGYEIRPVMSPDGQAVVFGFDYLYTTDVREPVRADEKHLGRVKRHFVHTDVQLSNFEMREVSKYWVSLKAARTGRGVALLQDVPGVGALFRPLPSASSSLQQNLIYSQATLFPTLFDLMGLRYAPAIADIDPEFTKNDEFVVRGRRDYLRMFIFDYGASRVDDALRILTGERRPDLYRSQHTIPWEHPNGYRGPGMRQRDAILEEGYDPREAYPKSQYVPGMVLPNRSPIPGGSGFVPESYELPPTMGGETKRGPAGLTPPAGMGFTPPGGEYTARPIGTTVTPQVGPASIRAPGASRLSPSIPPPGTPLPFPNELPK